MDSSALLEFAQLAIPVVTDIAMQLGVEKKNPRYACLGSELCVLTYALEHPTSPDQTDIFRRRIAKLLREIEKVCTWPKKTAVDEYPMLCAISELPFNEAKARVRSGLEAFVSQHELLVKELLSLIRHFYMHKESTRLRQSDQRASRLTKRLVNLPAEYPKYINKICYSVLRNHLSVSCTCRDPKTTESASRRHLARLRLKANHELADDGTVQFDMLLSVSPPPFCPPHDVQWQDMQLLVSREGSGRKRARFSNEDGSPPAPREQSRRVEPGHFCQLVQRRLGSRLCVKIKDAELRALNDGRPVEQKVLNAPSIPLVKVFESRRLTDKMKVALGYIIARSVWQFYNSDWMNTLWTGENIHFMQEAPQEDDSATLLYACKPYFSAQFVEADSEGLEFSDLDGQIHRYPRVLALGIMLIEIGIGSSLKRPEQSNVNSNWFMAMAFSEKDKPWPAFDYPMYWTAVRNCLDHQIFASAASIPGQTAEEHKNCLEDRRAILYTSVVCPLEGLLTGTGWSHQLARIEPMSPANLAPGLNFSSLTRLSEKNTDSIRSRDPSAAWLRNIARINKHLNQVSKNYGDPIKIAILDTGYDDDAVFFHHPYRCSRMKGWKDWVDSSITPQDCNGHGTHVVSLVMKVAPNADIFVARVAKDTEGLQHASENISEAIDWAVTDCQADIISMSFGFHREVMVRGEPVISRAIRRAVLARTESILFFAAAANYGANEKTMFPANHDSVIPIRGTNSKGAFKDFNPPRDPDEAVVYGTLGEDVPSTWLHDYSDEVRKSGTSVATPIAAGIAAMLLGYVNGRSDQDGYQLLQTKLRTRRGMLAMFREMAIPMGNGCSYLNPCDFFRNEDFVCWANIVAAMSKV